MIHSYLDVSTEHITRGTMAKLESGSSHLYGWPAMSIANYEYGCFVTVPLDTEPEQWEALPPDLAKVLDYARKLGAILVRFDAEGEPAHKLPTYDWN